MRIKTILGFAFDFIFLKKRDFIAEFILISFSLLLLIVSSGLLESRKYFRISLEKIFHKDIENICIVQTDGTDTGRRQRDLSFFCETSRLDEVKYYFEYAEGSVDDSELKGELKQYTEKEIQGYYSQPAVFKACGIKLSEGKPITLSELEKREQQSTGRYCAVYPGSAFKGLKVGDVFQYDTVTFEVCGVLEKNVKLPCRLGFTDYETVMEPYMDMEHNALFISDDEYYTGIAILKDGKDFSDFKCRVHSLSKRRGLQTTVVSLKEQMEKGEDSVREMNRILEKLTLWATVVSVSTIISLQVGSVLINRRRYGVLMTCGASMKDMMKIEAFEILIKFFLAIFIVGGLTYAAAWTYFGVGILHANASVFRYIFFCRVIWKAILSELVVLILGMSVPMYRLVRMDIREMIVHE